MRLPPELKLGILQYNEKKDLKAVRLTNKDWSVCTLQFLFDRIYWSPQNLDLEVFDSLVNNTELAPHIRELVFDACHFNVNTSKEEYFEQFCYCIILDLLTKDALVSNIFTAKIQGILSRPQAYSVNSLDGI